MNIPSKSILPQPFDWIEIPARANSPGFSISKYPITNAQFAKFIEAGGYKTEKWWTKQGWKARLEGWHFDHYDGVWKPSGTPWTEPRFWNDSDFNGAEQPVVGVSWYESIAVCLWLSEITGEHIMLPTEDQWQYAAQGDDGREYPWGNEWDGNKCQNSVGGDWGSAGNTTPVTQYEGIGDSPFGVVDMAGNVWEWCLTDYNKKTNDIRSDAAIRVLRGGCWYYSDTSRFRCAFRDRNSPSIWAGNRGFRIALS